jgi:WD40 repeat protein
MTRTVVGCVALFAALGTAASPTAWETTSYQDFLKARFSGLALSRDGQVTLAPKLEQLFEGEAAVWSIAAAPDGSVYLGTGHKGKLVRIDRAGKSSVVFTAGEAEIFAVTVDAAGRVYAGTSPGGKVYRIESSGAATEYFSPNARYIWSLTAGKDGALYAGTGDEGRIYRITAPGQGELYYETGQSHVTALAWDREGRLLAGSEPNGLLYRVTAKDRAFVLHDAALPEIRSIVTAPDGSIYVAAMGGSVSKQSAPSPTSGGAQVSSNFNATATTSITVSEEGAAAAAGNAQGGIDKVKPTGAAGAASQTPVAAPAASAIVEYAGVEKSAIYKIQPDNTVDTLWSSKEENVYDIALSPGGTLLIGADNQGRVYELDAARKAKLVADTRENEVLRLLASPAGALVATGTQGRLLRLGAAPGAAGELESSVHDTTAIARWGKLSWQASSACTGCRLVFRTRTGNSARPDKTWSDWSAPLSDQAGSTVASPNARYTQWKAEFTGGAGGGSPSLDWVRLAYLPQNSPPSLKSITVSAQTSSAGSRPATGAAAASTTPTYSITVTDTGEAGASSATGTPVQPLVRASIEQLTLSWLAEDPDNDKLIYSVWFRAEPQKEWKLLRGNFADSLHAIDAEAFADGRYWFRVTVSDRLSNPTPSAREDEIVSAAILIDRTPPALIAGAAGRSGAGWEGRVDVKDGASPLKSCEFSIDGGPWTPLAPADGVIDSLTETFALRVDNLAAGEHLIAVRAYDSANNAGVARFLIAQ